MSGIKPTEAHRMVNFQGKEKRMRMFRVPLAGDTDNDATYHDDYVAEDVPAAEPPVASPAQIQSKLSSFSMPASTKCHPELQYPIESSWAKMKPE